MEHDAGIDVSLERCRVGVVDATGRIMREGGQGSKRAGGAGRVFRPARVAGGADWAGSRPALALGCLLAPAAAQTDRARGARWLDTGMRMAGLAVELLETRPPVRAAFKTMPVKTDGKDARGRPRAADGRWRRHRRAGSARCIASRSLPAQA